MNFKNPPRRLFAPALLVLLLINCAASGGKPQTGLEKITITVESAGALVPVEVEVARSDKEHQRGLMFRTELADGTGMLFVFDQDQLLGFWMENTLIPLSIAYISYSGEIIDIRDMRPNDRSTVSSSRLVRYALEVPQGWFVRAGIAEGDIVHLGPPGE
ncbi:MAG: DUF192 domain-containing protein [Treponema sp.]|jgi:uncharacterized membrane protein (UPF0127 family)|nr:DUF192 domain-containing protein [Treponema sp.]